MQLFDDIMFHSSPKFQSLMQEEEDMSPHVNWEKEVLKGVFFFSDVLFCKVAHTDLYLLFLQGMETSFLMNTILRIGSLMQVGFGSAGTEIIRSGLERGRHKGATTLQCSFLLIYFFFTYFESTAFRCAVFEQTGFYSILYFLVLRHQIVHGWYAHFHLNSLVKYGTVFHNVLFIGQ